MSRKKNALTTELLLPQNGSKSVSPEKLMTGQVLAVTINPELQFYQVIDPSDRFIMWSATVYKQLRELKHIINFKLYPEISQTGRLHLHGYLTINNIAEFYLSDIPRIICKVGHIEIDTIGDSEDDRKTWNTYIKKCSNLMRHLCETNLYYYQDDEDVYYMHVSEVPKER